MYRSRLREGFLGITLGFSGRTEVGGRGGEGESTAAKEGIKGGGGCRKLNASEGRLLITTGTKEG